MTLENRKMEERRYLHEVLNVPADAYIEVLEDLEHQKPMRFKVGSDHLIYASGSGVAYGSTASLLMGREYYRPVLDNPVSEEMQKKLDAVGVLFPMATSIKKIRGRGMNNYVRIKKGSIILMNLFDNSNFDDFEYNVEYPLVPEENKWRKVGWPEVALIEERSEDDEQCDNL